MKLKRREYFFFCSLVVHLSGAPFFFFILSYPRSYPHLFQDPKIPPRKTCHPFYFFILFLHPTFPHHTHCFLYTSSIEFFSCIRLAYYDPSHYTHDLFFPLMFFVFFFCLLHNATCLGRFFFNTVIIRTIK